MDTPKSSAPAHPSRPEAAPGDPCIAAGRERPECPACYGGLVYIGRLDVDPETGDEVEVVEAVPCRRCSR